MVEELEGGEGEKRRRKERRREGRRKKRRKKGITWNKVKSIIKQTA